MIEFHEPTDQHAPAPWPNKRHIKLRISLFYDGTGNNRINTAERVANTPVYRRQSSGDDSYSADASNVAEIESAVLPDAEGFQEYVHVYTEGIGTTNRGADDNQGFALGTGTTGVDIKGAKGITAALSQLSRKRRVVPSNTVLDYVAVDTCGFSRGAAAARYAVWYMLEHRWPAFRLRNRLVVMGFVVNDIKVTAVGLFDTVSSYGVRHSNDVEELHLDSIRNAEAVYQLAAAEEYRDNFSLTNIASAGGRGTMVYLPGAHSDVGGGYHDGDPETRRPLKEGFWAKAVAEFMLARGWFHGHELEFVPAHGPTLFPLSRAAEDTVNTHRGRISTAYTVIPRRLMARWLIKQGVPVNPELLNSVTPDKVPFGPQIEQRALSAVDTTPDFWERPSAALAQLRHGFLHVSFRDEASAWGLVLPHAVLIDTALGRPKRRVWPNG